MSGYFNNTRINTIIKNHLDNEMTSYRDTRYAYAIMNKRDPNDMIVINNHPSWFNLYLKGNYQLIDPVIIKALDRVEDFAWDEKIMISSELKLSNIFNAGRNHNISSGHTFVLHDNKNNLAVLSIFEGKTDRAGFLNFISIHKEMLQYLLLTTHQKMLLLYKELEGSKYNKKTLLSQRENEILHWASMGKTYQEIAIILDIGVSTVKFHMRNVVSKLGVSNAKHAIRLAAELQIIRPLFLLQE